MKKHISMLIALLLPFSAFAGDNVIYLKCRYGDSHNIKYPKERNIVIKIDIENKNLIFEDFYTTGSSKTEYKIDKATNDKILASKTEKAGIWRLEINRVSGNWLVKFPIEKSQNKNLWNEEEKKVGYPYDVQLISSFGGLCEPSKPAF